MSSQLNLEDEDDEQTSSAERKGTAALDKSQSHPAAKSSSNFDGNPRISTVSMVEPQ